MKSVAQARIYRQLISSLVDIQTPEPIYGTLGASVPVVIDDLRTGRENTLDLLPIRLGQPPMMSYEQRLNLSQSLIGTKKLSGFGW